MPKVLDYEIEVLGVLPRPSPSRQQITPRPTHISSSRSRLYPLLSSITVSASFCQFDGLASALLSLHSRPVPLSP